MSSSELIAQPLRDEAAFNWVFLVDYATNGILALFFLFYFNRVFATLVSYGLRLYTWHRLRIYIDIEALQISFLAGRLFFKGIRYHGDNETIFIHGGNITWRYWLANVRECTIFTQESKETDSAPSKEPLSNSSDDSNDDDAAKQRNTKPVKRLPCRLMVKVTGVEAFLYNRGPAYDWVMQNVEARDPNNKTAQDQHRFAHYSEKSNYPPAGEGVRSRNSPRADSDQHARYDAGGDISSDESDHFPVSQVETADTSNPEIDGQSLAGTASLADPESSRQIPYFLRLLPVHVECSKGAVVLGNENTKSVIAAKFASGQGDFDASKAGKWDIFKILMDFDVSGLNVQMKPNVDYKRPQLSEAADVKRTMGENTSKEDLKLEDYEEKIVTAKKGSWIQRLVRNFRPALLKRSNSSESIAGKIRGPISFAFPQMPNEIPGQERWAGLTRYLQNDQNDEHDEWDPIEYAKSSVLADITGLGLKVFWDIPGTVPDLTHSHESPHTRRVDDINGTEPPEYGMDITVRGGMVSYGPWADRHRLIFQQIFFPAVYTDATPAKALQPGESRFNSIFKLSLKIEEETVLRIPFREHSRDWKWKGRASAVAGSKKHNTATAKGGSGKKRTRKGSFKSGKGDKGNATADVRPFAWFDIKIMPTTTINYVMDMLPSTYGYRNNLDIEVKAMEIYSSLNHGLLWRCGRVPMQCDLSHPLAWNGFRQWTFNIGINDLDFFLLRDHTFLLMDLIQDWGSGPQPDFFTFAPYRYILNVHFSNFKLFLNTNDANIVNNPDDFEDNNFVILSGKVLDTELVIPLDRFRPPTNEIKFKNTARDLAFDLSMPPKNTVNALVGNKNTATLRHLTLDGTYSLMYDVKPGLTDTLFMEIIGRGFSITFFGFFGRHLAKLKENYFGEDIHFRTLEEYQDLMLRNYDGANANRPIVKANDLDVILDITAADATALLPAGMYDAEEHIQLRVDTANVDLRVNNHYLELMVNSTPVELSATAVHLEKGKKNLETSSTQLFIHGVKVFGHRLFGYAPSEPPYVSNWDVEAGDIIGECSESFLKTAAAAGQAFAMTLTDQENSIPLPHMATIYDSTFVRFNCQNIRLWFHVEEEAFLINISGTNGSFHDLAGKLFSQRLRMSVPELALACVDGEAASRHRGDERRIVQTYACVRTSVAMHMVQRNRHFEEEKELQQRHIQFHDRRKKRAQFLLDERHRPVANGQVGRGDDKEIVSIPLPGLPAPLQNSGSNKQMPQSASFTIEQNHRLETKLLPSPITEDLTTQASQKTWNAENEMSDSSTASPAPKPQSSPVDGATRKGTISSDMTSKTSADFNFTSSRGRANLHPSTVAFSNPFKPPFFPLDKFEPDTTGLPDFPAHAELPSHVDSQNVDFWSEAPLDDDAVHTSLICDVSPGVSALFKPKAIHSIANLIERVLPATAGALLDQWQFNTIMEVLSRIARKRGYGSILDVSLRVPRIHVRFENQINSSDPIKGELLASDRYDLVTTSVVVFVRKRNNTNSELDPDSTSVHFTLDRIKVSIQEMQEEKRKEAVAFQAAIDDILVWLVDGDRTAVHASFRMIETAMASKEVEYLATLIYRTTMLADEFQDHFTSVFSTHEQRLQYLVYKLASSSESTADPPFLTRPSHIMRASEDHLRNSESWKIISKLRNTYVSLPQDERDILSIECARGPRNYPSDAGEYVLAHLDRWRSWDAVDVASSVAMRILYGSMTGVKKLDERSAVPIGVTLRAAGLKLIIDPGDKQNDFALDGFTLGLSITPPPPPSALVAFQDYNERKETTLQINTSRISLSLNWSICELIDQILRLFQQAPPKTVSAESSGAKDAEQSEQTNESIHIIFTSGTGTIQVETIHLKQTLMSEGLSVSITGSGLKPSDTDKSFYALIATDNASSELIGQNTTLLHAKVSAPSICVAYDQQSLPANGTRSLKIAADCGDLRAEIREEISNLLEVTSAVLDGEALQIYNMIQRHSQFTHEISALTKGSANATPVAKRDTTEPLEASEPGKQVEESTMVQLHLALFLDSYRFDVAIANGLKYTFRGQVMRSSVSPDLTLQSAYRVDFDLKEQAHQLSGISHGTNRVVSAIPMPPINGSLRILQSASLVTASITLTIEELSLEGHAVYGVLSTFNSPELLSAFGDIKTDVIRIEEQVKDLFPEAVAKPRQETPKQNATNIVFDANIVLERISINAKAPASTIHSSSPALLFKLQSLHFRTSNRSPKGDNPLLFPEFLFTCRHIGFELQSSTRESSNNVASFSMNLTFVCTVDPEKAGKTGRNFKLSIEGPTIEVYEDAATVSVEILSQLQRRIQTLDLSKHKKYLTKLRNPRRNANAQTHAANETQRDGEAVSAESPFITKFSFDINEPQLSYIMSTSRSTLAEKHDLVLRLSKIGLLTRSEEAARLRITNLQLALVAPSQAMSERPINSALLPEVVFNVTHQATSSARKFVFQAAGKALDIQLEPQFVLPVSDLENSLTSCIANARAAAKSLISLPNPGAGGTGSMKGLFGKKKISSVLVSADFAGAVVRLQKRKKQDTRTSSVAALSLDRLPEHGRYGQFTDDNTSSSANLTAPGIAVKVQYSESHLEDPSLNVEVKIDASTNTLYPTVVPLIIQVSDSVKRVVNRPKTSNSDKKNSDHAEETKPAGKLTEEGSIVQADPRAILGRTRLNIGFRICKQVLQLSCQPIAKVSATAGLNDIYVTINTVESNEHGSFFAGSAAFTGLNAHLKHAYSRDPTFRLDIESIVISLMNSKHLSGTTGISAILKINPTTTHVNAKQLQDILLFREIWLPAEIRIATQTSASISPSDAQDYFVQRYQQVAAAAAFPWNATIAIAKLGIDLDLGQAIGRMSFNITNFWASSKKNTSSRQNLCVGIDEMGISSTGRMSGFVELERVKVRTLISWPSESQDDQKYQIPLIQGSIGFEEIRVKAAFDYQAFAAAHVSNFEFLMYNIRDEAEADNDRLVAILDGDQVRVYCTATAAASGYSLYQSFDRLIQDTKDSYDQSLQDIERFLRRRSTMPPTKITPRKIARPSETKADVNKTPISLHTDVVVTLRGMDVGAFPSTLLDHLVLKGEASDVQARFAVVLENEQIHSGLGLTLGQLRVALANVPHPSVPKSLGEITVDEVVNNGTSARGGTILRVPKVIAAMQTWQPQDPDAKFIDYVFKSSFEGKIEVGWNYSRISFIRGMWAAHERTLASRLGKPLPEPALKITGGHQTPVEENGTEQTESQEEQQKITAVVNLPQSKYTYRPLEPPIIETPQLRDMGEATPPLEWIGLHRDKLPNVTHQIIIVTLLEIAKEVEDAYSRILGSA